MIQQFVDRETEMRFLESHFQSKEAEFIVIYGRRRVGKTELIHRFLEGKKGLYFIGRIESREDTIPRINLSFSKFFNDFSLVEKPLRTWDQIFEYLFEQTMDKKIPIVLDEFPFIVDKFPEILSVLQDKWDSVLKKTKILLILCGSSIGMMEDKILSYKSPLYGRRTGQWKLLPLRFNTLKEFFPKYSLEEIIHAYAVLDSIPGYLVKFDDDIGVFENIKKNILSKGEFLYEEAEHLLREEFRDVSNYLSIISAIAGGASAFNEIYTKTNLDKSIISKYLYTLEKLGIVKKSFPITAGSKDMFKSKKGLYSLSDNFFRFWLAYVYQNKTSLEIGSIDNVLESIKKDFNRYLGSVFEDVCRQFLEEAETVDFSRIGRWWYKDKEIDLVGLNEKTKQILFCECKWQDKVNPEKVLEELKEKAKFVDWNMGKRKEYYCVIAKSFSRKMKEENILLFDLNDMEKLLEK